MKIYQLFIIYAFLLIASLCFYVETAMAASPDITSRAHTYMVKGVVTDAATHEPVAFASVAVEGIGVLTNDNGEFTLSVPSSATEMHIACTGYAKKVVELQKERKKPYQIILTPVANQLEEVVVRKKKYRKKNNPAVDFAVRLKEMGPLTDPRRNPYYNYEKYELITFALNDFSDKKESSWVFKKFPFLWDHVDTSEVTGKPILNIIVKEKSSDVHFRRDPRSEKEVVKGLKQNGIDDLADQASIMVFMEDVLREIDLYNNDITILQNRFVSPLSRIAPDFYKFYLTDTVEVDNEKCIALSFYPHNTATFGFNGQVFVPVNDSTMFIKKVTMRIPRNINLNFIDNLYISQEFERAPDGSRLRKSDDLTIEGRIMPGTPSIYARRTVAYDNHTFDAPADESVFSELGQQVWTDGSKLRDEEFWEQARLLPITDNEKNMHGLLAKMRSVPLYYWTEKTIKVLTAGYVPTGNPSKFDYGPVNTTISHNYLEGYRFRVGGMTTANLSKRWFGRGYIAWGTKDHKWKYRLEAEHSFLDKEYHSREFPVHALRFTSSYNTDHLGEHYMFTNADNIFLSLKRMSDSNTTYLRANKLEYILELRNNFSVNASVWNEIQESSPLLQFRDGYDKYIHTYSQSGLTLQLRYAPGEKFYQTKSFRAPINLDSPIFVLSHTISPQGWFGSRYMINKTEASAQKRFWFSAFGFFDVMAKGGHVWSQSPFPNLMIPNANLSYTIQPESFALMNPMEFVTDSYASIFLTYWANGAIFNYIPLLKKLKFREVFSFNAFWGHLSDRNKPSLNPFLLQFPENAGTHQIGNTPYMEASVGLDNILSCLRIDYVWRLSYLDVPYYIDRKGLRLALHFTF